MTGTKMTAGQRIGLYLSDHGVMQSFVASQAGIEYQRFHDITKGKRKLEAEEFLAICKVLDKDPDYLLNYEQEES